MKRRTEAGTTRTSQVCAVVCLLFAYCFSSCSSSGNEGLGAYPKAVTAADETSAIQALRTIASAQNQAKAMRNSYANFDTLVQLGFLDERFAGSNPNLRGYRFSIKANESEFAVTADPQPTANAPAPGGRHFYLDSTDNAIHVNSSQSATRQDPVL
jgi:Tfp pilus assembly protein PilE